MRVAAKPVLAALFALLAFAVASRAASPVETLQVTEDQGRYSLVVPVSGLTMTLPRGGLTQGSNTHGGSAAHPRYFFFQDKSGDSSVIASGWFEPQRQFVSAKKIWEDDTAQWRRKGLPEPTGVLFQKIGNWDAVIYDHSVPGGSNTHLRAHWVEAGTWIDLHLSLTSPRPIAECRAQLLALLKSITVTSTK